MRLWNTFCVIIDKNTNKGSPLGCQDTLKKLRICDQGDIGPQVCACAYWAPALLVCLVTLPTRQELNKITRDDIYRQFIKITWVNH